MNQGKGHKMLWLYFLFPWLELWSINFFLFPNISVNGSHVNAINNAGTNSHKKMVNAHKVASSWISTCSFLCYTMSSNAVWLYSSRKAFLSSCCGNREIPLCKMCLYSELFWSAFSRIWTEYGETRNISSYSVRMRKNADQTNSE